MNDTSKVVVSRTLKRVEWGNTKLIKDNLAEKLSALKSESSKDIAILGSSRLSASLLDMGLIDELRVIVNPVILGAGRTLFDGINHEVDLKLLKSRPFKSGNILLYYQPSRA
ncbi:MAG TPA: dihydrofolate reductase family protein [Candidatus Saccharimonadales bacterium]|jgi:dihydrofolate reductase|nr:dihydrofolate reductase family protein [Candidatus Saccharimonadales bacterium]